MLLSNRAVISPGGTGQGDFPFMVQNLLMRISLSSTQKEVSFLWQTQGPERTDLRYLHFYGKQTVETS